ncbi:MAG: TolC family protein [Phycisphaerales bacterium]|nr:TolC family protein [Phycisphaerales bacterium]
MNFCYSLLFLLAVCFSSFNAVAQNGKQSVDSGAHAFSIDQCVTYSHNHSFDVQQSLIKIKEEIQTNRIYTAAALPNIVGIGQVQYNPQVPVVSFGNFEFAFGTRWQVNSFIQLQQVIFDGQVFVGLEARRANIDYAKANAALTEHKIKINIYKVYNQILVAKIQLALLDSNIVRLQSLSHDIALLYQNGFGDKLDVDRINVQLKNIETNKSKLANNVVIGMIGLKILMGMPLSDSLCLTDSISENELQLTAISDSAVDYSKRLEYQQLEYAKRLANYDYKRYKFTYIPSLSLTAQGGANTFRNQFDLYKGVYYANATINLNLQVPIYDGNKKQAQVKMAALRRDEVLCNIQSLERNIDRESTTAVLNFHTALDNLWVQKDNIQLSESIFNQIELKHKQGVASFADIRNANSDLDNAQSNYINALIEAVNAQIDYFSAVGKL